MIISKLYVKINQRGGKLFAQLLKCADISQKDKHSSSGNLPEVCRLNGACWWMYESLPCSGLLGQACMMEP